MLQWQQAQSKLKKVILLVSIILLNLKLFSLEGEFYFEKGDCLFISPIEFQDKKTFKILKILKEKKFDKAKAKLLNLKLNNENIKDYETLKIFIEFLKDPQDKGENLEGILNLENPRHKQIKAEILWLNEKKMDSFKIYGEIPREILDHYEIKKLLERRTNEFSKNLEDKLKEVLMEGNYFSFCLNVENLPERIFNTLEFYKGKTLCGLIKRDIEVAEKYFNLLDSKSKEFYKPLLNILKEDSLSYQLKSFKEMEYSKNQEKLYYILYKSTEDLWLLENMPPSFMEAYNSKDLSFLEFALILCFYFPQIKADILEEKEEFAENLNKFERECLYYFFLNKIFEKEVLEKKLDGDILMEKLHLFLNSLNLLNPCEPRWESYIKCGIIQEGFRRDKIDGKSFAEIIRKIRGDYWN